MCMTHQEDEDGGPSKHRATYETNDETQGEHGRGVQVVPPLVTTRQRFA